MWNKNKIYMAEVKGNCAVNTPKNMTVQRKTQMRTIHVPSTPASTTRRRSGDDPAVVHVKHGCVLSRMTSNNRIWGCGRPGTELTTGNSGVKSWKQRRSSRGMLHDDDDKEKGEIWWLCKQIYLCFFGEWSRLGAAVDGSRSLRMHKHTQRHVSYAAAKLYQRHVRIE